MTMFWT